MRGSNPLQLGVVQLRGKFISREKLGRYKGKIIYKLKEVGEKENSISFIVDPVAKCRMEKKKSP